MADCQVRIQVQGLPERRLRLAEPYSHSGWQVFRHDVVNPPEPRPRRRVTRVGFDASQVEIASRAPLLGVLAELIGAQIVFVGLGTCRDVLPQHSLLTGAEFERERRDDALGELVLQAEHVANRGLRGMRAHQCSAGRVRELRRNANLVARGEQRPGENQVDVGLGRDGFQVVCGRRKAGRDQAGANHQGFESR